MTDPEKIEKIEKHATETILKMGEEYMRKVSEAAAIPGISSERLEKHISELLQMTPKNVLDVFNRKEAAIKAIKARSN